MLYLYFRVFVLFILAAVPLGISAKPLSPRWDDMHTKHSWNAVPKRWETMGHPPSNVTIDLYVALKPHRENALVDVLYEVSSPGNPKHVMHHSFSRARTHCPGADMVPICRRSRSPNL